MSLVAKSLLLFASLGAIASQAQFNTKFQYVIVIVQENRTPDNLFGQRTNGQFFEPGVNLATTANSYGQTVPLTPVGLQICYDVNHFHSDFVAMYDNGLMDGANGESTYSVPPCKPPKTNYAFNFVANPPENVQSNGGVQPYFQLAKQSGFANYMFQTNQGPSFPAHQFLFSGTSAPDEYPNMFFDWFAEDDILTPQNPNKVGCIGVSGQLATEIGPGGTESNGYTPLDPPGANAGFPCYDHPTLVDVLNTANPPITWKYYTQAEMSAQWTAPTAIDAICQPTALNGKCKGSAYQPGGNISTPPQNVLSDILSCSPSIAQVSFVTPDGAWSDHAGGNLGYGPSWVADIVNAIVVSKCNPGPNWSNTAILITWDDWGGWYDHVPPPLFNGSLGYSNGTAQEYVYGFRVPLLVVSKYTQPGYVSGPVSNYSCPNYYCHDFGSILNFVEYVFGSGGRPLGTVNAGNPIDPYADGLVMDLDSNHPYSLSEFFDFTKAYSFKPVAAPLNANFFINYTGTPQAPDDDDEE